jgi:hypothetical protein
LLAVSAAALGFWCVEHSHYFGWKQQSHRGADDPFTALCLRAITLVRMVTLVELAAVVATVPGGRDFSRLRQSAIRASVLAFLLWLVFALTHIDWEGRPLEWRAIRDPHSYALLVGSILARAVSAGLGAAICGHAFVNATRQGKEEEPDEHFYADG